MQNGHLQKAFPSGALWPEPDTLSFNDLDFKNSLELCDEPSWGNHLYKLIEDLYPIQRSITGHGVRESLAIIGKRIPLTVHEVASGTPALDWTVPREWNIRDAYIKDSRGNKVVDFRNSCLHVLGYSVPINGRFSLAELKKHIFTIPERPDWIPFRYSYYNEDWGFCMAHKDFEKLEDGDYEVVIDSSLEDGSLTYGEWYLPGECEEEMLLCAHIDHPAMCNDNLSGVAVAAGVAELLGRLKHRRLSYRVIFIPTTIGSLVWLSRNKQHVDRVKYGFSLTCIGDTGGFRWKEPRRANTTIDRAVKCALRERDAKYEVREFTPFGFDERQFCSPGFNLPFGCLYRTHCYQYPENHTSADDLTIVKPEQLADAARLCLEVAGILDRNLAYLNTRPEGEQQLGKHGIYRKVGGPIPQAHLMHLFWILNYSDGEHSLLDIAEKSKIPFSHLVKAAEILEEHGLIVRSANEMSAVKKHALNGSAAPAYSSASLSRK